MRKLVTVAAAAALVLAIGATPALANDDDDDDRCHSHQDEGLVLLGSPLADRLVGTACDDTILGFAGNDVLRSRDSVDGDFVRGGRGNDRITSLGEFGRINGGSGFDTCVVPSDSSIAVVRCEVILEVG